MPEADDETLRRGTAAVARQAASSPERPWRKDTVGVYVPHGLHRTMRRLAIDDDRSASDLSADSARAFLAARGVNVDVEPTDGATGPGRQGTMTDLAAALARLGSRIEDALVRVEASIAEPREAGYPASAGATAATAVKALLGILGKSGGHRPDRGGAQGRNTCSRDKIGNR